jgi:glutaredoxin
MRRAQVSVLITTLVLTVTLLGAGCKKTPTPLQVRDESSGMLFTWIDERGDYHVEQFVRDVPEKGRDTVRVVDPTRDDGTHDDAVYLVDLRAKGADGVYPARTAPLSKFEEIANGRRALRILAARTAPSAPVGDEVVARSGSEPSPRAPASANTAVLVTIYGASWCGPCHDAERFLQKRGIRYVMRDVERDEGAAREMQSKLQAAGRRGGSIPVIDVGGKILVGYSEFSLEEALGKSI